MNTVNLSKLTKTELATLVLAAEGALQISIAKEAETNATNERQKLALAKVRRQFADYYAQAQNLPDAPKPKGWCSRAELDKYYAAHPGAKSVKLHEIRSWLESN